LIGFQGFQGLQGFRGWQGGGGPQQALQDTVTTFATTSTTYTDTGLDVTVTGTGDVIVHFTGSVVSDVRNRQSYFIILINGATHAVTERICSHGKKGFYYNVSVVWKTAVTSGDVIKIQMKRDNVVPVSTHTLNNGILVVEEE